jgi:hypothetical protein
VPGRTNKRRAAVHRALCVALLGVTEAVSGFALVAQARRADVPPSQLGRAALLHNQEAAALRENTVARTVEGIDEATHTRTTHRLGGEVQRGVGPAYPDGASCDAHLGPAAAGPQTKSLGLMEAPAGQPPKLKSSVKRVNNFASRAPDAPHLEFAASPSRRGSSEGTKNSPDRLVHGQAWS